MAIVRWSRPEVANSFDAALATDLAVRLTELGEQHDLELCVLHGSGRHFCAGWDLNELRRGLLDATPSDLNRYFEAGTSLLTAISRLRPLVVSWHGGVTAGFGLAIAARSDLVLAHPDSTFGCPELSAGVVPHLVAAELVGRLDERVALAWLVASRLFPASQAQSAGLVDFVVETDSFESMLDSWRTAVDRKPGCLLQTKAAVKALASVPASDRRGRAVDETVTSLLAGST